MNLPVITRALRNIFRIPGRSILMGGVLFAIALLVLIGLSVNAGTEKSIIDARKSLGNAVVLQPSLQTVKTDEGQAIANFEDLTESYAQKLVSSKYIENYDYAVNLTTNTDLAPLNMSQGDGSGVTGVTLDAKGNNTALPNFRLLGNLKPELLEDFSNATKRIVAGRMYDKNDIKERARVVVIDKELAKNNKLNVGDSFNVEIRRTGELIKVNIIGIYEDNYMSTEPVYFPAMIRGNTIHMPYTTVQDFASRRSDRPKDFLSFAYYYLDDPLHLEKFKKDVISKGIDLNGFSLDVSNNSFSKITEPMKKLSDFTKIGLVAVLVTGGFIMILLMTIITRERKNEIGILRALGVSKSSVALQLAAEALIICIISLLLGGIIGSLISQGAADYLLQKQKVAVEQQNTIMSPAEIFSLNSTPAGSSGIHALIGAKQIILLFLGGIFTCLCGSLAAARMAMKYEPMKMLSNRI